jgi:RNA polymerase subunit RPABC4/transcription elongation factor Spt4
MAIDPQAARRCSRCGREVPEQARFCEGCGAAAGSTETRICRACGTPLGPGTRFCPQCGRRAAAGWGSDAHRWGERVRALGRAVNWPRVGIVVLPPLALLMAGIVGYTLGQQHAASSDSSQPVASATRSWREETAGTRRSAGRASSAPRTAQAPASELVPGPPEGPSEHIGPPTRFRDFRISASSWELAHPPAFAADGDPYTFWHAWKTERFHNNEWLTLTFPTERVITRVGLLPGRAGPGARAEGRVRSVLVKAGGQASQKLLFGDEPRMQLRNLNPPVRTRKLVLRIVTVLPGRETRHIVIPEVQVWGYPAPARIARRSGS